MTFYLTQDGKIETGVAMTGRDLKYVMGLCGYERDRNNLTNDKIAETIAKEAFQDETYWTSKGLDLSIIAQRVVQLRLDDMRLKWDKDNTAIYTTDNGPIHYGASRLLESIYEDRPILSQKVDNAFLYEDLEEEEIEIRICRGETLFRKVQKHVDQLRGFRIVRGIQKPLEEKEKSFFENVLSLFGVLGKNKRDNTPTP